MRSLVFIGGCAGTNTPSAAKITAPSLHTPKPLIEPWPRTEYGTLTTSFGIVVGDAGIFIDNGGGIIHVAELFRAMEIKKVYGLQTHFHMDHMLGIQNNGMLFRKNLVDTIYAPTFPGKKFRELFDASFDSQGWPIGPKTFGIEHHILDFEPGGYIGDILMGVRTLPLNHPGGAVAYRIALPFGDVVIASDTELVGEESTKAYAEFVSGARILYADVQYRTSEYAGEVGIGNGPAMSRKNWGHSTPEMLGYALSKCESAPRIVLAGHHDPSRNDQDLRVFEKETVETLKGLRSEVRFARECDSHVF